MTPFAVILAGGSGTRFWPKSRRDKPKQLLRILSDKTMLEETVERLDGLVPLERTLVVTHELQATGVRRALPQLPEENLIAEPFARGTAAAIGLAAAVARRRDPEAAICVLPSDHWIRPRSKFQQALRAAFDRLARPKAPFVLFGVKPRYPATGFGYITRGRALDEKAGRYQAQGFVEKPPRAKAEALVASGDHYWNAGIFAWRADDFLVELEERLPRAAEAAGRIAEALGQPAEPEVFAREYEPLETVSVDVGVLEKARRIEVIEADYDWSDVGSWAALPGLLAADEAGNTVQGKWVGVDTKGSIVVSTGRLVATIGAEDLIVVETRDAVLVARKDRAEDVKGLVDRLRAEGLEEYL